MGVAVFFSPLGTRGATERLFKAALKGRGRTKSGPAIESDYSGIFYLAPTSLKVKEARGVFHRLAGDCYIPPVMTTPGELSKRLCTTYGESFMLPKPFIAVLISWLLEDYDVFQGKGIGLSAKIAGFISEMKENFPGLSTEEIKAALSRAFDETGVPSEVSKRSYDALKIFEAYRMTMQKAGAMDETDAASASEDFVSRLNVNSLIIDGFFEISKSEETLFGALINRAQNTFVSLIKDDITNGFNDYLKNNFRTETDTSGQKAGAEGRFYQSFPTLEEEIEGIARHIKSSYITGRQRELSSVYLVYPSVENVLGTIERVFTRYGIPFTTGKTKNFLERRNIDILRLIESVSEGYPRLKFAGFLTSRFFENIPPALRKSIPPMSLSSIIVRGEDSWLDSAFDDHTAKSLKSVLKKLNKIDKNGKYGDYVNDLISALNDFGFLSSDRAEGDPTEEVLKVLRGFYMIEAVYSGLKKGGRRSLRGFSEALRHVFSKTPLEDKKEGVNILDFSSSDGIEPEDLYLGGLKDGDIPSRPDIDLFLPESVRKMLGLDGLSRHLKREEFRWNRLCSASLRLHLSYPSTDGDKFFLPSVFLSGSAEIRPEGHLKPFGFFSKEEEMTLGPRSPETFKIPEISGGAIKRQAGKRFGVRSYINVTDIDSYRSCPRRFFIENILGLRPPEISEYEVEAKTLGIVVHRAMERLTSMPYSDLEGFCENSLGAIKEALSYKPRAEDFRKNPSSRLDKYLSGLIEASFLEIAPKLYLIEEGLKEDGFFFREAERKIKGEPFRGIRLKGKIDRIDESRAAGKTSEIEILDYKTGPSSLSASRLMEGGESLQLLLYAMLLKVSGAEPLRAGIYSLKDLKVSWIPAKKDKNTLVDYMEKAAGHLKETVKAMRGGDFTASPLQEQTCRRCHERAYCPYIQGKQDA